MSMWGKSLFQAKSQKEKKKEKEEKTSSVIPQDIWYFVIFSTLTSMMHSNTHCHYVSHI